MLRKKCKIRCIFGLSFRPKHSRKALKIFLVNERITLICVHEIKVECPISRVQTFQTHLFIDVVFGLRYCWWG